MSKFVFNFTPTGMIPTKAMTEHVPISPGEIVEDVACAATLGVNMVHIHARDPETGMPTCCKEVYAEIIRGIRAAYPGLIITASTSGRVEAAWERRAEVLDLEGDERPDMASLTLSSLNFNTQASLNSPGTIQALAARMNDRGVRPELEVFDAGMINYARYLLHKGLLNPPFYFNLILGNIACAQCDPLHMGVMIRDLPEGAIWSIGGVGRAQLSANALALAAGGGVRVGLEDNIWYDGARTRLAKNRDLLLRIRDLAAHLEREPFTCTELRDRLGLPPFPGADHTQC